MIKPFTTEQLAVNSIQRGLNPDYLAACYLSNAADVKDRIERLRAKSGSATQKIAGYTMEDLEGQLAQRERLAVEVPQRMREILAKHPELAEQYPLNDYQRQFKAGDKLPGSR